jgi:CheY-like chemotaxis protein
MKLALLVENNQLERDRLAKILRWLGYIAAPVHTPDEALNVAGAINFDLIVTGTAVKPNDRRTLTSELKRLAPKSAIVLVASEEEEYRAARAGRYPCVNAVLKRPTTMDALWRTIRFGLDGLCLPSTCVPRVQERRHKKL